MTTIAELVTAVTNAGVTRAYKLGAVPASPAYPYAVVGFSAPDKIARSANGQATELNRFTVQFFGRTLDAVLDLGTNADLDGDFINGALITRELTTPPYRDPDDSGVLTILHTYRF